MKLANFSQVERTLQLWANGDMKTPNGERVKKSTNKPTIKAASKLNPNTGVVSNVSSNFSAENWAAVTSNYYRSIDKMKLTSLEEIVRLAMKFMSPSKSRRKGSLYGPSGIVEDDDDVRACLVDE
jgi:hypothetical protein